MAVSVILYQMGRVVERCPNLAVVRLERRVQPANGVAGINLTDLFGPHVIVGHIDKSPKRTDPAQVGHAPTGFFEYFAVEGGDDMFSGINSAAWQLEFMFRFGLIG